MSDNFPPCPQCNSAYTSEDRNLVVCPECGHEWNLDEATPIMDLFLVKVAYGTLLQYGDMVSMIKDIEVKGSSSVAKVGAKVKINHLVGGDHNIDCKITGIGAMMSKSEFIKKA
jgi:protein PhnA